MANQKNRRLRIIPPVHEVVAAFEHREEFRPFMTNDGQRLTLAIRQALQELREHLLGEEGAWPWDEESAAVRLPQASFAGTDRETEVSAGGAEEAEAGLWGWLREEVLRSLRGRSAPSLRHVINATGVILHTNCGRALLAPEVAEFVAAQAGHYSNLELNLESGERGSRYVHVEKLLCALTGAEAAMVVNNNAAAVLLIMNTLAAGGEVVVSRGELVEVGGSFRIPEVLKAGGARLVEVGATNKTWLRDYEGAIGSQTALLLKVHTSNYRIEGFTHSVSARELVELGARLGLPVVEDLGSGSFLDGSQWGLPPEPTIGQSVEAGLSLVSFSGDKLLGGPQAGIIVGKKEYVERLRSNQLTRALRIDKLTLAGLEGTLRLYAEGRGPDLPVWHMLAMPPALLRAKAERLCSALRDHPQLQAEVREDFSQVGGGAWPTVDLPTWVCALRPRRGSVNDLEEFLRRGPLPILARIQKDRVLLDGRTLLAGEEEEIIRHLENWF
ncbi:L-seryl-tRNA(Sec) selenium transferase [Acididesulfobacillus acetoxydans]|nr:L-seryl-tRNA(Sec) selenium transferase [Acididesulfobacillus acetoxydans]